MGYGQRARAHTLTKQLLNHHEVLGVHQGALEEHRDAINRLIADVALLRGVDKPPPVVGPTEPDTIPACSPSSESSSAS